MRKALIISILIFFPIFAIAGYVEVTNEVDVEVTNKVDVEVTNKVDVDIGEIISISKPLKQSTIKGFLEGEVGKIKFHFKINQIKSIAYLSDKGATLINAPPIYDSSKLRSVIVIKSSIMQYEQVIKLIKSSESWW